MFVGYVGLGIVDIQEARYTSGTASLLLAVANYLLLVVDSRRADSRRP